MAPHQRDNGEVAEGSAAWARFAWETGRVRPVLAETASPLESLLAGVRAFSASPGPSPGAWVITPVDRPPVAVQTLQELLGALTGSVRAVTPCFQGRGGHPVVLHSEMVAQQLLRRGAGAELTLRDCLRELGAAHVRLSVAEPSIAVDWNEPDAAAGAGWSLRPVDPER